MFYFNSVFKKRKSMKLLFHIAFEKILTSFLVLFLLTSIILFYGTVDTFIKNHMEFDYNLQNLISFNFFLIFKIILISLSILVFIPIKNFKRIICAIFSVSILLWLEGAFIGWQFGALDGSLINWNSKLLLSITEIIIWVSVIVISIIKYKSLFKHLKIYSIILLAVLWVLIANQYYLNKTINMQEVYRKDTLEIDESVFFDFSAKKNIIMIVVDEFQSDLFFTLLKENENYYYDFNGFEYFPNTLSTYPWTNCSIPNILTGQTFPNLANYRKFLKKAYAHNSIPQILTKKGFDVHLFPKYFLFTIDYNKGIISNLKLKSKDTLNNKDFFKLIDLTLLKFTPHFLKRIIYNNNNYLFANCEKETYVNFKHGNKSDNDELFIKQFKTLINKTIKKPLFKFIHLYGAHSPYNKTREGAYKKSKNDWEAYKATAYYKLSLLIDFLNTLKNNKLYNSSSIYILSDHGGGQRFDSKIHTELISNNFSADNNIEYEIPFKIKSRAIPLFLRKLPGDTGKLKIKFDSVSLSDIKNMVTNQEESTGEKTKKEERAYYYYKLSRTGGNLYEYNIIGNSWHSSSWKGPLKVITHSDTFNLKQDVYFKKVPQNIEINEKWGSYNDGFRWIKNESTLTIKDLNPEKGYFVIISFYIPKDSLLKSKSNCNKLVLKANNKILSEIDWIENDREGEIWDKRYYLTNDLFNDSQLNIEILHPDYEQSIGVRSLKIFSKD